MSLKRNGESEVKRVCVSGRNLDCCIDVEVIFVRHTKTTVLRHFLPRRSIYSMQIMGNTKTTADQCGMSRKATTVTEMTPEMVVYVNSLTHTL